MSHPYTFVSSKDVIAVTLQIRLRTASRLFAERTWARKSAFWGEPRPAWPFASSC